MPKVTPENNLQRCFPNVAAEWHPTLNGKLTPDQVPPKSGRKFWWLCPKGHSYDATGANRTKNSSQCPYCGGSKVCDDNCLATLRPDVAAMWHPTKNGHLTSQDVTIGSGTRVWWRCQDGHDYSRSVTEQVRRVNCPTCSGRNLAPENSVAGRLPHFASQWHPTKNGSTMPIDVHAGSDVKVWWVCSNGHEFDQSPKQRGNGYGCRFCAGFEASETNNLQVRYPSIAARWHPTKNDPFLPTAITAQTKQKFWFVCQNGHDSQFSPAELVDAYKKGREPCWQCRETLLARFPRIAKEWHPTKNGGKTPADVRPFSYHSVWWQCSRGHEWEAKIVNRTSAGGRVCPKCSYSHTSKLEVFVLCEMRSIFGEKNVLWRKKIDGVEADIWIEPVHIVVEVDGEIWHKNSMEKDTRKNAHFLHRGLTTFRLRQGDLPRISCCDVVVGLNDDPLSMVVSLLRSILENGDISEAVRQGICEYISRPYQRGQSAFSKIMEHLPSPPDGDSLADRFPAIAAEWSTKNEPLMPEMFRYASGQKVWWECSIHGAYERRICNRTAQNLGCRECAKISKARVRVPLSDKNPLLASLWHPTKNLSLSPKDVSAFSRKKVWWLYPDGREIAATVEYMHNRVTSAGKMDSNGDDQNQQRTLW